MSLSDKRRLGLRAFSTHQKMTPTSGILWRRQPASFYFSLHFVVSKHSDKLAHWATTAEAWALLLQSEGPETSDKHQKATGNSVSPSAALSPGLSVVDVSISKRLMKTASWWRASPSQTSIPNHNEMKQQNAFLLPWPCPPLSTFCANFNQLAKQFSKLIFKLFIYFFFLRLHHCHWKDYSCQIAVLLRGSPLLFDWGWSAHSLGFTVWPPMRAVPSSCWTLLGKQESQHWGFICCLSVQRVPRTTATCRSRDEQHFCKTASMRHITSCHGEEYFL